MSSFHRHRVRSSSKSLMRAAVSHLRTTPTFPGLHPRRQRRAVCPTAPGPPARAWLASPPGRVARVDLSVPVDLALTHVTVGRGDAASGGEEQRYRQRGHCIGIASGALQVALDDNDDDGGPPRRSPALPVARRSRSAGWAAQQGVEYEIRQLVEQVEIASADRIGHVGPPMTPCGSWRSRTTTKTAPAAQRPPTSKRPRAVRNAEYLYEAFLKVSVKTEPVALVCSFPLLISRSPPFNAFSSVGPSNPR
jgi:hypothetical protein